jgi:MSHA biogenesis protein MshL
VELVIKQTLTKYSCMRVTAFASGLVMAFVLAACGTRPLAQSEAHIQPLDATRASASIPPPIRAIPLPPPPEAREVEVRYTVVVASQPVREVLLAMAREAKINFDIHPGIEGAVTLNAIDQTLKQILTRMSKQVDMRWEMDGTTLVVMPDSPFLRNYRVDYVNLARDVSETVGIATQVISGTVAGAPSSGGGGNNSTLLITSTARHRFWETIEKNIKDMLRETDKLLPEGSSAPPPSRAPGAPPPARAAHRPRCSLRARRSRATPRSSSSSASPSARPPR